MRHRRQCLAVGRLRRCGALFLRKAIKKNSTGRRFAAPPDVTVVSLIICKRTRPVLVLHERKSRVTLAARLAGKTAAETISVMLAVFARIEPALRKSITFDNDTAFAQHALLRTMRAMTTWFCDAYASWQKGGAIAP